MRAIDPQRALDIISATSLKVPPGTYSARGAGGHFLVVIPSRNLVVVHRFDNDPPCKDVKTVFESVYKGIGNAEFGPLLQLILDFRKEMNRLGVPLNYC